MLDPAISASRLSPTRLGAVRKTLALDAAPSEVLDRYTRLAARLLGVPATFLSLVDADRDFYVSHSGFAEPLATQRELRGPTFCHLALVSGGPVVIGDTHADPAHRAVPTVDSLGIHAYLGIPMELDGEVIGSMCAIDFEPRVWSQRDIDILEMLAGAARHEMQLQTRIDESVREAERASVERERVELALRTRQEVMNAVAHDLRNPLGTMTIALAGIDASITDPAARRVMEIAKRQARLMREMLDDLLDDARLIHGTMRLVPEPTDVGDLLRELETDFGLAARDKGVSIETAIASGIPPLSLDRRRITQACANLISNALRFTPRGGRIVLGAVTADGEVVLTVRDSGKGFDEAQLFRIFEPYYQGSPMSDSGLGLGLHIARSIVELHDGRIGAEPAAGGGALMTMRFPVGR